MSRKDELINRLVEEKRQPTHDELKEIVIHLRDISLDKIKTSYEEKHGTPMNYTRMNTSELVELILDYDAPIYEKTGSHVLPEVLINNIHRKKENMIKRGEWKLPSAEATAKYKKEEQAKFGKVEIAKSEKLYPYETEIPKWIYFTGKDVFLKMMDGERIVIGETDGENGIVVYGSCNVDENGKLRKQPASINSCAVALTVGKVSKILKINAVLDNALVNRERYISIAKDYIVKDSTVSSISKDDFIDYLRTSPFFKKATHVYIEKVKVISSVAGGKSIPYESIESVSGSSFKKSALLDAGRVFMFEMIFGTNDNRSQTANRSFRLITKVYTNPRDIRVGRILDTINREIENKIKIVAEDEFAKTKTILDDAQFIEGMNEVRSKVSENADTINEIINKSNISREDKDVLMENVEIIKQQDISLSDVIESTFRREIKTKSGKLISPLKHRLLVCEKTR